MSVSTYAANKNLNAWFGSVALGAPATFYVALSTSTPNPDGSNVTEPVSLGYNRVSISNGDKTNWTTATTASLSNSTAVTFPESTGSWGTIVSIVLYDALTSGNMLFYDTLTPSRAVAINTTVYFAASGITISMT